MRTYLSSQWNEEAIIYGTWKSFEANLSSLNEFICELVKQSETSKSLDGTHEDPVLMRQLISSPAYIPGFRSLRTCKAMKSFDTKHPAIQNTRRHCIAIFVAKFSQSKHSASLTIRTLWRRFPTSDVPIHSHVKCTVGYRRYKANTQQKFNKSKFPSHLTNPDCKVSHSKLFCLSPKEVKGNASLSLS